MDIQKLEASASKGSAVAQTILGIAYLEGLEIEVDYAKALNWLSKAAEQGAPRALMHLGRMYEDGLGTIEDIEKARTFYERSANAGEFLACISLGRLYRAGKGMQLRRSEKKALYWYSRALEMRHQVAECPELFEATTFVNDHGK